MVHPIVVYFKQDHKLTKKSFSFLLDDMEHDTSFVRKLQQNLTEYIKNNFPTSHLVNVFQIDKQDSIKIPSFL